MRARIRPSLNFLLLVLVFSGTGAGLWHGWLDGRIAVFVLVVSGWIVGLCLHEFAHALTAHLGGDHTIDDSGYLTLDPLKYTQPMLSLVLPILFIFLGGFGLPGGAVYIRTSLLRSAAWESAVAAAGPLMSLAFLVLVAAMLAVAPASDDGDITELQAGLGVLAYFQATAVVLNLLPIPGLDGFGIIRPYLPARLAAATARIGALGFVILILLLWYTPAGPLIFQLGLGLANAFGVATGPIARGFAAIRLS